MKTQILLLSLAAGCLLIGCARNTRSISQSNYQPAHHFFGGPVAELDEFAVLGLDRDKPVSEEDIQRASKQNQPIQLNAGDTILLVQSGAAYPDGPMVAELNKHFRVIPFTGVAREKQLPGLRTDNATRNVAVITDPDKPVTIIPLRTLAKEKYVTESPKEDPAIYSRTLRLAAARAGASKVVCYWGILESGTEKFATKTISWLPVVNWVVPDERQHMRLRLKMAVVDVASGSWSVYSADPLASKAWSVRPRREVADQKQVETLKKQAYELAAQGLFQTYNQGQ